MARRVRRSLVKRIARERIILLLEQALSERRLELARRYVELARKISMKHRVRIPLPYRRLYCKRCLSPLVPGRTARFRLRSRRFPHIVIRCEMCGELRRIPYLREKKIARSEEETSRLEENRA